MGKHAADSPIDDVTIDGGCMLDHDHTNPKHRLEENPRQCHFCGEWVKYGVELNGDRHWLSDCRPDLVKHEEGDACTWAYLIGTDKPSCYAYKDQQADSWTPDHKHFFTDGPM